MRDFREYRDVWGKLISIHAEGSPARGDLTVRAYRCSECICDGYEVYVRLHWFRANRAPAGSTPVGPTFSVRSELEARDTAKEIRAILRNPLLSLATSSDKERRATVAQVLASFAVDQGFTLRGRFMWHKTGETSAK